MGTHREHEMARTTAEITQAEVQAYVDFCQKHGINLDGEDGVYNGEFVREYFLETWQEDITPANLALALKQLRPHLKFRTEDELEFNKIYNTLSAAEKQAFAASEWPFGVIRNEFNGFVLLKWLKAHRFEVTERNLSFAAGQGNVAGLLQWNEDVIRQKPKAEPDPNYRPGRFFESSDEKRRREAEEASAKAAAATQQQKTLSASDAQWRRMALDKIGTYRSHSQRENYQKAYDDAFANTGSYRAAFEAVVRVWKEYNHI
jgi:hypothetical protein